MKKTTRRRNWTNARRASEHPVLGAAPVAAEPRAAPEIPVREMTDEQLFERYTSGDPDSFSILMERYQPRIQGFLRKRLNDEERVQDLTQDTFLRIHRARAKATTRAASFRRGSTRSRTTCSRTSFGIVRAGVRPHFRSSARKRRRLGEPVAPRRVRGAWWPIRSAKHTAASCARSDRHRHRADGRAPPRPVRDARGGRPLVRGDRRSRSGFRSVR